MFAPPVISDLESQTRSMPLPVISVKGFVPVPTAIVDMLRASKPPWALPVMLEPAMLAWELLLTKTPWPWLAETVRLAPAFRVPPSETSTPAVFPPTIGRDW